MKKNFWYLSSRKQSIRQTMRQSVPALRSLKLIPVNSFVKAVGAIPMAAYNEYYKILKKTRLVGAIIPVDGEVVGQPQENRFM